jgi:hypothetical protein
VTRALPSLEIWALHMHGAALLAGHDVYTYERVRGFLIRSWTRGHPGNATAAVDGHRVWFEFDSAFAKCDVIRSSSATRTA